jgi:glutaredoxin
MLLKIVRESLGRIIIFIDWVTRPKAIKRSVQGQAVIDAKLKHMKLYQLYACPFCIKTRRALRRLNLVIETRNVQAGSLYRDELEQGGGRIQVPCLHIQKEGGDVWMYESSDIIAYLEAECADPNLASEIPG